MSRDNYDDQFNNPYEGFEQGYGTSSEFYQNNAGYPMQSNQGMGYGNNWTEYGQMGYDNGYTNYQYDYYDDNIGYIYDDQYSIDYSNSSSNFMGYDYNTMGDMSLYDISSKLNENCEQELFFERANNMYNQNLNGNMGNINVNTAYTEYGENTMPMDEAFSGNYDNYDSSRGSYTGMDTNSSYYNRSGSYDNKIMPTEDIMFDDMYIVKNQLFEEEEKLFSFNDIVSLAICVAFAIIMAFLINRYAGQITTVDGHSMEYNFHHKEILVLDKLTYKLKKPERYDVVVFPVMSGNEHKHYIKRIIGLPGEKVYIDTEKSEIYIDDKKLSDEIYGWEDFAGYGLDVDINNITLADDEYYCMGDNRNNSMDSRSASVGPIKGEEFVGKAIFKIYPMTSFGLINHKYNHDIRQGKKQAYEFKDE